MVLRIETEDGVFVVAVMNLLLICRGGVRCTRNVDMCSVCLQFALLENVLTSISDEFTALRNHKLTFCISTAVVCYLVGLSCVTYVSNSLYVQSLYCLSCNPVSVP